LGYERDVRNIISALDEQQQKPVEGVDAEEGSSAAATTTLVHSRQTLLCSATLTTGIEQLSEISLRHPGKNSVLNVVLNYLKKYFTNEQKCYAYNITS
jgi:superfamily II DNA/RNA helicase